MEPYSSRWPKKGSFPGSASSSSFSSPSPTPTSTVATNSNSVFGNSPSSSTGSTVTIVPVIVDNGGSSTATTSSTSSTVASAKRQTSHNEQQTNLRLSSTAAADMKSNFSGLMQQKNKEMETSHSSLSSESRSSLGSRSISLTGSAKQMSGLSSGLLFKRSNENAMGIVEMPSPGSDPPDEVNGVNNPIVTSPVSELNDMDYFSDPENAAGLTSPQLISAMNPGLSLTAAPKNAFASAAKLAMTSEATNNSFASSKSSLSKTTKIVSAEKEKALVGCNNTSASSLTRVEEALSESSSIEATGMKRLVHQDSGLSAIAGTKMQQESSLHSSSENMQQHASKSQTKTMNHSGSFTQESHHHESRSHSSKSSVTMKNVARTSSLLSSSQINQTVNTKMSIEDLHKSLNKFDDLENLTPTTNVKNVESALVKYCSVMSNTVEAMKRDGGNKDTLCNWMSKVNDMMTRAWKVPSFGHEIGNTLCDILRNNGGLDILIDNCVAEHKNLQFNSAKLLQQCLVTENRGYVVEKGLDKVVAVAKAYTVDTRNVQQTRVGTGILEHLFKHSETTCGDVIAMGGLDTVVNECKSTDVETLRQCASALANVAMYGGAENQEAMIQRKVPSWLFPLAFHTDDTIKYYACLAIAVLVANKEIEAAVQKSGTLDLIEPFVQTHTPADFAITSATHSHGQSPNWLRRLIPVLLSHREEARNLAAFHFCMEAEIKKQQGSSKTELFHEIGSVESLRKVASGPNGIASKYAAQTLRLIGEEVPHKLSQQVPTWSVMDVKEWVKQIGFPQYADSFEESRVDGDLLLQLSEDMLREDIAMRNGILRRRFLRELTNLKRMADYSSCDPTNLNGFLQSLGQEYSVYTYDMLNAGIDRDTLLSINEEQLLCECGIKNKIHRLKIQQGVKVERGEFGGVDDDCSSVDKSLDVFISYRRSNGSQLASLLKVHLEIRNMSVFLDVDRLEAGNFDNNLLQSIRSAKNFVLVLTPGALDRCMNDDEQRDWIHKEVACALSAKCNIIPIFDNFKMPDDDQLPPSMRAVTSYNGVKWIHDYQDACVDKIERFIRGDASAANSYGMMDRFMSGSQSVASSVSSYNRQNTYQRTISNDSNKGASASSSSDEAPLSMSAEKE